MRKIFVLLVILIGITNLSAEISVKSFRKLENDLDARVTEPIKDQNGDLCAIIKVVTNQTGFSFDGGQLGIVKTVPKPSEIWVYVPYGLKRMSIFHPALGQLRDYMIPINVEKAAVYEMVLVSGRVETTVVEEINSQWLIISPEPANGNIYINDAFVKTGTYQAKLKPGSYTYRVESPLYHTDAGKVELGDAKKELNVTLKPNFGYLSINTLPENDAQVVIDGKPLAKNTPCKSEALKSGEYTVQVIKEMFQPTAQKVTVTDGQTTAVNFNMQPNFAELNLTAPQNAKLMINNQQKGTGTWKGRLNAGVYTLEAQLDKHRTDKKDIELIAGDIKSISLTPKPIYGSLDVVTTPVGATITLNGKDYGTTPNTINNLLIGDYTVILTKTGYATTTKTTTITDGKSSEINVTLSNGRAVTINSTPTGANLYVDNQLVGTTPYSGNLTFGSHTLRIEQNGKRAEKSISVAQTGGNIDFNLTFGPKVNTETVNGVSFDMVAVKGGTFSMGSENGKLDEKPIHRVMLSDYTMGKTEVTQALWQAVMGINQSYFKGENLPVEQVNWNEIQGFLQKLNQLTGKTYRLPTEAEWEYAAGGGASNRTIYAGTDSQANLNKYAWYSDNSDRKTHTVATKLPNALGLYDMSGNVWEWCSDWKADYNSSPQLNPTGATSGTLRVTRGGSWDYSAQHCHSAYRTSSNPDGGSNDFGFRLVLCNDDIGKIVNKSTISVEEDNNIYLVVEQMPSFPGGDQALFKFLGDNVIYPVIAQKNGIQGRVICQFVVNRDGSIVDVEVVRPVDPSLDREAKRVIQTMPKWVPGLQRGKPVRVKYTLPINFRLQ